MFEGKLAEAPHNGPVPQRKSEFNHEFLAVRKMISELHKLGLSLGHDAVDSAAERRQTKIPVHRVRGGFRHLTVVQK